MERRFSDALRAAARRGSNPVIADLKSRSPKEGDLFGGRSPVELAVALQRAGVPALSVVTESEHFGGSLALLQAVVQATGLPVLRKDFFQSEADVEAAKAHGASAVLLICATTPPALLRRLFHCAHALGMEALVETHDAAELAFARELGAQLVGINNREIAQLELDDGTVQRTQALAAHRPPGALLISESGMYTPADVNAAIRAGADAVLIGTAILQAPDPAAFYRTLQQRERA